jgi:predicted PurR-regulated permease PerM
MKTDSRDAVFVRRSVQASIRIGALFLLLSFCHNILRPFIEPLVWGVILAVSVHPVFTKFESAFPERPKLVASVFTVGILGLVIGPSLLLLRSLTQGLVRFAHQIQDNELHVPSPPDSVRDWPFVGKYVHNAWELAFQNLHEAIRRLEPYVESVGRWLLDLAASAGSAMLGLLIAVVVAGFLLHSRGKGEEIAVRFARRLAGEDGVAFVPVARATISSVARGVLGVALIQSVFAGLGFLAVGLPAAGLFALGVLIVATLQLPVILLLLPITGYVFWESGALVGTLFGSWCAVVGLIDNFLKPILLGRGVDVPMVVILIGAIGGMIYRGILGLFLGAVILALAYKLLLRWMDDEPADTAPKTG